MNLIENNTYLFDKCSICYKEQSLIKKFFILKYCINCNLIICNDCKDTGFERKKGYSKDDT